MTIWIVTPENIEEVRATMAALDQAADLEVGCETWRISSENGQAGQMTVWPGHGRAAVAHGANSEWGNWNPESRILTLDDGRLINARGQDITRYELSGEYRGVGYTGTGEDFVSAFERIIERLPNGEVGDIVDLDNAGGVGGSLRWDADRGWVYYDFNSQGRYV